MNFNDYQKESRKTAIYPKLGSNIVYPTLGLCGESGEMAEKVIFLLLGTYIKSSKIAEKVKKIMRDDGGIVSVNKRQELRKELGDVLWYLSNLATELELSLDDIAQENIYKLTSRKNRGLLKGDGDNR